MSKKGAASSVLPPDLTAEEVQEQLERILATDSFLRAERLSRFLRHAVEQALKGHAAALKEYSIALAVFDRPDSFDGRIDPIVRVEAGRLRAKIREYYQGEGKNDPVWVGLRSRGYRPMFKKREEAAAGAPPLTSGEAAAGSVRASGRPTRVGLSEEGEGTGDYRSIAVLPLADLSPQQSQEYFCDALSQQIINGLTKLEQLRVVGRTSVSQFKNKAEDVREIGRALNVDTVLEGSVQKAGKQVRITVQLLSAANGLDLWGERYDRPLEDVFAIQDDVTQAVVRGLKATLLEHSRPSPGAKKKKKKKETSLEAYNHYLKGLYHWNKRTETELQKSIEYFENCIAKDPQYGPAYAGLAGCYVILGISSVVPPQEIMPKAMEAASRALELDSRSTKAQASLGLVHSLFRWDWAAAQSAFDKALQLNPRNSTTHHWYAIGYLLSMGRLEEALTTMSRARDLNPASVIINTHLGLVHYMKRECERAIRQFRLAIEMEPQFYRAYWDLGRAYLQNCMLDEALEAFEKAHELSTGTFRLGALGHCYAIAGKKKQAQRILRQLEDLRTRQYISSYEFAELYLGLGEHDAMFEWLDKAFEECCPWLSWLAVEPVYDGVRADARFTKLVRKLGLKREQAPAKAPLAASP